MELIYDLTRRVANFNNVASRLLNSIKTDAEILASGPIPLIADVIRTTYAVQFTLLGHVFLLAIEGTTDGKSAKMTLRSFELKLNFKDEISAEPLNLDFDLSLAGAVSYKENQETIGVDDAKVLDRFIKRLEDHFFVNKRVFLAGANLHFAKK